MSDSLPPADFELVFQALVTPHAVVSPELVILAANDALVRTMGRATQGLVGCSVYDAFPPNPDPGGRQRVAPWLHGLEHARQHLRPHTIEPQRYDVLRPDGRYEVRYWQGSVRPLLAPDGTLRHLLVRAEDVTRRVQAEHQGSLNHESFQLLTRATHDVVWEMDVVTGQVRYNQAFYQQFGYTPADGVGGPDFWRGSLHPDDAERLVSLFQECVYGTAEALRAEYRMRRADGSWADVRDCAYIVRNAAGEPLRLIGAMQDVTLQRTAERALQQSEASFRLLADAQLQMGWSARPDGVFDYVTPYWSTYTGQPITEALHENWLATIHPDDLETVGQRWQQSLSTGAVFEADLRMRRHDGEYRWFSARGSALYDDSGTLLKWIGATTDVHDRRTRTEQQRQHDRRLLQQLDQLPLHLVVLQGPDHVVEYASSQARAFLTAESLGKPARDAQPSPGPALLARFGEVYRTGQTRYVNGVPALPLHADSSETRILNLSLQPLLDDEGRISGVIMAGLDVTDQLQNRRTAAAAMAETQRQQEQFHFLTEFIPQLVWSADETGRFDYFNQRWTTYTGYPSATTDVWAQVVHPDDWPNWQQRWAQSLNTGEYFSMEVRLLSRHGTYRWFLGQALPLRNAAGTITKWFGTGTDIDDSKHAQHQLVEKDRQLQQILGQVPAHLCTLLGPEHVCGFATPGLLDLFGGRLRVGWPIAETLTEVREQGLLTMFNRVFHTGFTALEEEYPLAVFDGPNRPARHFYFDLTIQALLDEQSHTQGLLFFAVDVTERVLTRQRNEALTEEVYRRDEEFRVMVEALPNIVYIVHPNGSTAYLSPQWYAYTGHTPSANPTESWADAVHPDDLRAIAPLWQHAQTQRQPWSGEIRLRRHDGQWRWHLARTVPAFDADGQIVRWYGASVDHHEQRELQELLGRREAEFRLLAESIPQLVWVADAHARPTYFNQRWVEYTGFGLNEFREEADYRHIVHPHDLENCLQALQTARQAGEPSRVEYRLRERGSGNYRWFIGQSVPLRDAAGQVVQWFGTCTDIHEQKELTTTLAEQNTELRRINQDLDGFVYTASHDLKQPINNMAGIFQELTRSAQLHDPDTAQLTAMFERALHQIHGTIEDLTELVQVQKIRQQVAPETVHLQKLTTEVLVSLREQLTAAGALVELNFEAAPTVQFVRPNLQSVLFNLLSNAIRYASPQRPPRIRVWSESAPGQVALHVQDNGLGIDMERYGPQLFQMFRRFHPHIEGSGMGLYLVQRIVHGHGGQLEVQSRVGEGTTFSIKLRC